LAARPSSKVVAAVAVDKPLAALVVHLLVVQVAQLTEQQRPQTQQAVVAEQTTQV
jgi:hypothetical protein